MAEAVGTIRVDLFANTAEFSSGLDKASGNLKRFARDAEKTAKQFDKVGKDLTRNLTLPLVAFAGFAIKAAADAQDLQGAFNLSFASMADEANAWAVATGQALGRSTQRVQETAIAFNEFFEDFAPNSEAALDLSKSFTVLTEDFAAFHNVSREQSQQILLSGLAGSAKALKKFGIDVSDAAVKQRAMELGIASANAELTEQQKVLARASIIIAGTAKEQGEVTRSTGEAAEETERAKESFKELLVTVGNDLLPVFNSFLASVHEIIDGFNKLDPGTRKVIEVVGGLAAVAGPAALAVGGLTRAAGLAATAIRGMGVASVASVGGIKQVGLSARGATVAFLALAPVAWEAGKAVGSVVDSQIGPKFSDLMNRANGVKDALIAQGVAAKDAHAAVSRLVAANAKGIFSDINQITVDNARAFLQQAQATEQVAEATDAAIPSVDELLKTFGDLGGKVDDSADKLQRVRDIVDPTGAALREYNENLTLAKTAGIDAGEAQRALAKRLVESIGGIDGARVALDRLPASVQKVVRSLIAQDDFATMLEGYAERESAAAEQLKKIHDDAVEAAKRLGDDFKQFADDLNASFDPAAVFEKQMARIEAAYGAGKISAEVYKAAKDAAFAETPAGKMEVEALRQRAALVGDLADALTNVATNADDAGEIVRRFVLELLKAQIIKPFFQGIADGFVPKPGGSGFGFNDVAQAAGSFLFGGTRDAGGPVFPGMSYRIGSGVSETFVPDVPGHIERGPGNSSGGGVTVNQYITTPDANSFRASTRQTQRDARRGLGF